MTTHIAPLVRVSGLRKVYASAQGEVEALRRVDMTVEAGEFVAILGPSGCGKSTLLMMVAGLERPSDGRVEVGGRVVTSPRRGTALVFQDASLLPWKTALNNVLYPAAIHGAVTIDTRERARQLLDRVGLAGFHDRLPRHLSGGMRQRVALCRALVQDPDLLLMDEPFSALDAITRDEMNALLLDIWGARAEAGAMFVTHSIREAAILSDRIVVMRRRPCTVLEVVDVPFPRPRLASLVDEPDFVMLCARLRSLIEIGLGERQAA